jgi:hypothetical protein
VRIWRGDIERKRDTKQREREREDKRERDRVSKSPMKMRRAIGLEVSLPEMIDSDWFIRAMLEIERSDGVVTLMDIYEIRLRNSITRSHPKDSGRVSEDDHRSVVPCPQFKEQKWWQIALDDVQDLWVRGWGREGRRMNLWTWSSFRSPRELAISETVGDSYEAAMTARTLFDLKNF